MKCPNCGKEALFVNGKYVCVDCGIEITPEQQAVQNQASDPIVSSGVGSDLPQTETPEVIKTSEDTDTPADSVESQVAPETPEAPAIPATPVQDYFEDALKTEEVATPEAKSGVYDFTENTPPVTPEDASPAPMSTEDEATEEPTSEVAELNNSVTPNEDLSQPSVETTPQASEGYFAPNTFDMNAQSESIPVATEAPEAPNPVETGANLEPAVELSSTEPEVTEPQAVAPSPEVTESIPEPLETPQTTPPLEAEPEAKSLDDMLDSTSGPIPTDSTTVSAYGPSVDGLQSQTTPAPEPTPTNIASEEPMPSVESVFGTGNTPSNTTNDMPTAQDFGVAPPPPKEKKNIWPIVAAAIGGVLLVGGAIAAIFLLGNNSKTVEPVALTDAEIVSLSNTVTTAMQAPQGIATDYTLSADFAGIIVKDDGKEGNLYREFFAEPYSTTASWSADPDGNITLDATTGDTKDKRTYIGSDSTTYVYSEKDDKYTSKAGLQLSGIPAVFGVEEKAATFYTTNIDRATSYDKDTIDGVEYFKYEIVPTEEIVSSTLESLGTVFSGVTYQSLVADKALITAWVSSDGKIKKLVLSGEVSVETEKFSGKIIFSGQAEYSYTEVTIINPGESPGSAATEEVAPVTQQPKATNQEEGQTSSISSEKAPVDAEEPLVDARG